ncbi:sensor domain-containing diguanylate cyclase, partial [bacterium]|nr:sensor domain-containing diguanylate cyclase [bacterium]
MSPALVLFLRVVVVGIVAFVGALGSGYGYYSLGVEDWEFIEPEDVAGNVNIGLMIASIGAASLAGIVSWIFDFIIKKGEEPKAGEKSIDQIKEDLSRKMKETQKLSGQLEESKNRVLSLSSLMVSLSNMAKVVGSTLDPHKVIEITMENVIRNMHATKASLILIAPETNEMELAAHHGWDAAEVQAFSAKMGEGIVGYCAEKNIVVDDESLKSNPDLSQIAKFTSQKTHICAPLSTTESMIGVLNIEAVEKKKSENRGEEMRLVTILTSLAGMAIQNAALFNKTQEWATIDALTGLNNRRSMLDFFENEMERADREGTSVTFFMSDIDHFKGFNDTYGHAIGDFVLAGVAQEYKTVCRDGDLAGRYGGEEFGQILPATQKADARAIAEKLRKNIESKKFETEAGKLSVTLSVGVASYPEDGKTLHEVMTAADDMLYVCKESGRNMVCVRGVDKINEKVALKIALDKAKNIDPDKVPELEAKLAAIVAAESGTTPVQAAPVQAPP